jgi:hypothetical protein
LPEHAHVHAPHELSEPSEATTTKERVLEFSAALLLALATVAIAWSGYQSARWSGVQAEEYARATSTRTNQNRLSTSAGQQRLQDLLNFNRWLEVSTANDQQLADLYVRRFRPEFVPAFNAWVAQDPVHNVNAVASPLLMPEYRLADFEKADHLEEVAAEHFDKAKEATENADHYILITVFLAAVLFFAGISLRFRVAALRIAVLGFGAAFLLLGVVQLALLPAH